MNKESLIKIRNSICGIIDNANLPTEDKLELLINLYHYLDPNKYEKNISILKENDERERLGYVKHKTKNFR